MVTQTNNIEHEFDVVQKIEKVKRQPNPLSSNVCTFQFERNRLL